MSDITGTIHSVPYLATDVRSSPLKQKVYETCTAHTNIPTRFFISGWAKHLKRALDNLQGHHGIGYVQCRMKQTAYNWLHLDNFGRR
jgi:hypothetical protein